MLGLFKRKAHPALSTGEQMNWADKMWDDCFKIALAIHASRPEVKPKPWKAPYVSPEARERSRLEARRKDMAMEIYRNGSEE